MIEAAALLNVFEPGQVAHWAKETGFIRRERALSGWAFLLMLTVGRAGMKHSSLAGLVAAGQLAMSREALHQRFTAAAAAFLERSLLHVLQQAPASQAVLAAGLLDPFRRVLIADSSGWNVPPALQGVFRGYGGSSSAASCKLQLSYDFKSGELAGLELTPGTRPDNAYVTGLPDRLQAGDLLLFDQGYFKLDALADIHQRSAFFLTRLLASTSLQDAATGASFDLAERLARTSGDAWQMPVRLAGRVPARLVCLRVPSAVAEKRRQKLFKEAKKKGRVPGEKSLQLCAWTLLVTNVPEELVPADQLHQCYALRWQIELLFKQLKSILGLHLTASGREHRLRCEIYGKLIVAALIHRTHALISRQMWNRERSELSFDKLYKRIQERCFVLLEQLRHSPRQAWLYFQEEMTRLTRSCLKNKQKSRPTTLERLCLPSTQKVPWFPLPDHCPAAIPLQKEPAIA
jgi:IS4 transposase